MYSTKRAPLLTLMLSYPRAWFFGREMVPEILSSVSEFFMKYSTLRYITGLSGVLLLWY